MTTEIKIQLEKSIEKPPLLKNGSLLIVYAPYDIDLSPRTTKIVDLKFSIKMSKYICNSIQILPFLERNGIGLSCKEDTVQLVNNETMKLTNIQTSLLLKINDLKCKNTH